MRPSVLNVRQQLTDADIRSARADNPKMRERDLATNLGISEARFIDAFVGHGARRLRADHDAMLRGLAGAGEVMALTRNAFAVHEKTGRYEGYRPGDHVAMVLGEAIDLRVFPSHWVHAFSVARNAGETSLHSIQVFDVHGNAVHKVFTRETTDMNAWRALVDDLARDAPSANLVVQPVPSSPDRSVGTEEAVRFRAQWADLTDTHQIAGLLKRFGVGKAEMVQMLEPDFAWRLDRGAMEIVLRTVANERVPVMVFVRNAGCLQVHAGPIWTLKQVGPWLNVMDPDFHLHLRTDKIDAVWVVRKPTANGDVLSIEALAADATPIILVNGMPGHSVRAGEDWRLIVESLPKPHKKP